ncbi:hypothetical protein EJ05DRAFT_481189 [Pseudovirgaria hyperparasitica]|uniref:Uncharacterized protein n=1 Tax=Pseudovirgaria hyperparasitica TaxID=470096 RepID=A0A6A6VQY3_9PEZI|nr:uncharacterized protein EJ05DRAFT_481189 [Pseudovirgaria hyperparasitica]KAF2752545.1 hypothetical protein EJ05DRAFT_481189 [Pseudovirgaria hyperparasitica]
MSVAPVYLYMCCFGGAVMLPPTIKAIYCSWQQGVAKSGYFREVALRRCSTDSNHTESFKVWSRWRCGYAGHSVSHVAQCMSRTRNVDASLYED